MVDVNKGDQHKYNVRCRLVGKELKARTKEALLAHEPFSAMPPWETVKSMRSFLVTDGISDREKQLEFCLFDISRAHFMPKADREPHIEEPHIGKERRDCDFAGRLKRSMNGFRDASNDWMRDLQNLLESAGHAVGKAIAALFLNKQRHSRCAVHGNDFYVLASRSAIDHMTMC